MKNKGVYFFDGTFAYLYILFGYIFNIADSFCMQKTDKSSVVCIWPEQPEILQW